MTFAARLALALAVVTGTLGATGAPGARDVARRTSTPTSTPTLTSAPTPTPTPTPTASGHAIVKALAPREVLGRYRNALQKLKRPKTMSFEYAVEQLGLRNLEQTHRVYRSGRRERDETLIVDGYTLQHPSIRIIANRSNRYDVSAVAPRPGAYAFAFASALPSGGSFAYAFHTKPVATTAFAVSDVEIDGRTFLPVVVRFAIVGRGARGKGELRYEKSEAYWLVRSARVNVRLTNGARAHEKIVWTDYQFPMSLPPSTFDVPKAMRGADRPLPGTEVATPVPVPPPGP